MDSKKLDEIVTILRSIVLQDQSNNIFDSKFVNGLNFENNKVHFTLELLPEQSKRCIDKTKTYNRRIRTTGK
jgi:hypothetical protein